MKKALKFKPRVFFYCAFFALFGALFLGCEDSKVELSDSKGASQSRIEEIESLDKASYAGLENVFLDTKLITPDNKPLVLIFGKNNCTYCDKFKDNLKADSETKELLARDFSAYYINIDYTKTHEVKFGDDKNEPQKSVFIQTLDLAKQYQVRPTPTFIFADSLGNAFFAYPGFLKPAQFRAILERIKDIKIVQKDSINALSDELFKLVENAH
ncbi:hypothetical protein CQA49_07120 [Helicobacter sp. MIT 00-7814]|uniref:thioredoxin fold domain-containing protein n=1 Tax=unclassified Helicobacter TaxID=2593540 RepID=UPI000E1E8364|nr:MULTISPECIES: thioredoxin fold domain-containing protein [unclassified Helicobacter]RDU52683.1 hypothetical protein CQA37_08100 [Helicobacter sp. MIT 99-10781]RDU53116.1 hypothetical protein CQA49_07120 [Helicobacter sp. MIT 00-7814]